MIPLGYTGESRGFYPTGPLRKTSAKEAKHAKLDVQGLIKELKETIQKRETST